MGGGRRLLTVLAMGMILVGVQVGAEDFCRNRKPSECCTAREDTCEVFLSNGGYCYCDEFCLEGTGDCCPDFAEVCLGAKPKPEPTEAPIPKDDPDVGCLVDGVTIPHGSVESFNCNECKCEGPEAECESDRCMVEDDLIKVINHGPRRYGWRATNYTQFFGRKLREGLTLRTGTSVSEQVAKIHPVILYPQVERIPPSFDARVKWVGRTVGVRDQGWCGSSWVFSTVGVAQDRLNIQMQSGNPVALSEQNVLSCTTLDQDGCASGPLDRAWNFLKRVGVVKEECYGYESGWSGEVPSCSLDKDAAGCEHRYKYEPSYRISPKEEDIQWEILTEGPVQAVMDVHPDFFLYRMGVYTHTGLGGTLSSTHSVKILGWGELRVRGEGLVKYWLAENSWGPKWGDKGFFKIRRGSNECGIESLVFAARPRDPRTYE